MRAGAILWGRRSLAAALWGLVALLHTPLCTSRFSMVRGITARYSFSKCLLFCVWWEKCLPLGTCLQIRAITHAVRKQIVKFLLRNCHISNKRARCWLQDTPLNHCWLWNFFSCASCSLCTVQGFMVLGMIIVDWTPKIGHCRPWLLACVEPRATLVHYVLTPWPAGWPVCFLKVPCTLNQYMT